MSKFSRIFSLRYAFFILILTLYLFPVRWVNAQTLDSIISIDKSQFLDSNEFYDEKTDTVKILYTYEKQPSIDTSNFIFDENGNSNTEKISDTQYKIYSNIILTIENEEIKQIDHGITDLETWNTLQIETLEDKINKLWTSPLANAQTYYPSDNVVIGNTDSSVWSTCRAQTTGNLTRNQEDFWLGVSFSSPWYYINRGYFNFSIPALDSNSYVNEATMNLYITSNPTSSSNNVFAFTESTAQDTIVADDMNNWTDTKISEEVASNAFTTSAYNVWDLNSTGIDEIASSSIFKLAFRNKNDYDNLAPTSNYQINIYSAYRTGTANDPYLTLTLASSTPGEEPTATTTATSTYIMGATSTNLAIITSWTEDGMTYYYVPFLIWLLFAIIGLFIFNRLMIEFLIRWRK